MLQIKKLKNGLNVLLLENHKSPVVSVQMWVKTGSADELKGEEGISHFIEHLVFKGTEKYKVGEIASVVEAAGGELNAWTSFDQTVFYVNISKSEQETALDVIGEMMGSPTFDASEIDAEREVVIEEIKRGNDSPSRKASQHLFGSVYTKHPYRIPVIGYDKVIKKVSRKKLVEYYNSRYSPANMDLVVAGDFKSSDMLKKIEARFGKIPKYKVRPSRRPIEPAQKQVRVRIDEAPFSETQFHWAWRVPGPKHADIPALEVMALIVGQGESARLTQSMRVAAPLVNSVGAGTFIPKDGGFFSVSGTLNLERADEAFSTMANELVRICHQPPSDEEMQKAITCFEAEEFYSFETIEGLARKIGSFQNLVTDPHYPEKFLKRVKALKASDIQKVAKKYLTAKTLSAVMIVPKGKKANGAKRMRAAIKNWQKCLALGPKLFKKKSVKELKAEAALLSKAQKNLSGSKGAIKGLAGLASSLAVSSQIAQAVSKSSTKPGQKRKSLEWKMPSSSEIPKIEKLNIGKGINLVHRMNHATPVVSARFCFLGGMRCETKAKSGSTELLSRAWTAGAGERSEVDIQNQVDGMASSVSAFGGRNTAGLSMQSLSHFQAPLADLLGDLMLHPTLPEDVLTREKVVVKEAIISKKDNPTRLASRAMMEMLFAGHPYSLDPLGTPESLDEIHHDDVAELLAKMISQKNLTVALSGSYDLGLWKDLLAKLADKMPAGAQFQQKFQLAPLKKSESKFIELKREQTHIMLAHRGLTLSDPNRYALRVANAILSGMGGRLFVELREKASLAYSVSPIQLEGTDTGYFGAYIGCSPEKGEKAIAMMREELGKLASKAPSAEELEKAKRSIIGRHDIDLQRNSSIADAIMLNEAYGIGAEEIFNYANIIQKVTASEVAKVLTDILKTPEIMVAVGAKCPWK
jgi:zinc protease